jgi:nucleotide-binding universal stress UspA family protein
MTTKPEVLAVEGGRDTGLPVDRTAEVIARLVGGEVRPLRLAAGLSPDHAAGLVVRALREPGPVTAVLTADEASGPVWQRVAQRSAKPVVLIPPQADQPPPRIRRVLLPLDGTARSAAAVAEAAERFVRGGAELVVLHVFDADTVPKFWDQQAYAGQAWEAEFLARFCALPGTRLVLHSGAAADFVVDVAEAEQADMIAMAWSQRLVPGHAAAVRQAVWHAHVPVMLVPMPAE